MANITYNYGGSTFNVITDSVLNATPTPLMTISTNPMKDFDGNVLSYKSTISLDGLIFGNNTSGCLKSYSGIINFFSDTNKQGKSFQVYCDAALILEFSGTYFNSANAEKSNNNWVTTIPYSLSLESIYSNDVSNGLIESFDESWTVEPLDEVAYYNSTTNSRIYEFNNSSVSIAQPPSLTQMNILSTGYNITNFLQYRISHKISAVGHTLDTGSSRSQAYAQAAKWVLNKANSVYTSSSSPSGIGIYNAATSEGLRLYNHMRTIDSTISAGTYSLSDTWLALGTGVKYTEDFTWEISTDDKTIKTVTVQGTIKGLEEASAGFSVFPDVAMTGNISGLFKKNFGNQTSSNNKYFNALGSYVSGVKPFLYQRASQALSSVPNPSAPAGRSLPVQWIGTTPSPLNITPISYSETLNPIAGTVSYNVSYNNKPGAWLSGVLSSVITVTDNMASDQIADVFVLGRPLGPILEKVGNSKSERRVNVEIVYPAPTGYNQAHPQSPDCVINKNRAEFKQLTQLIESFKPVAPVAFATLTPTSSYGISNTGVVFITSNNQVWSPMEGRFSWDISWVYSTGCA